MILVVLLVTFIISHCDAVEMILADAETLPQSGMKDVKIVQDPLFVLDELLVPFARRLPCETEHKLKTMDHQGITVILCLIIIEDRLRLLVPHNHRDDSVLETPIVQLSNFLEKSGSHFGKGVLSSLWNKLNVEQEVNKRS